MRARPRAFRRQRDRTGGSAGSGKRQRLIRLQARSALADLEGADHHAAAADALAQRHELPLVAVFTGWYRALRLAVLGEAPPDEVEAAYQEAAQRLDGAGSGLVTLGPVAHHLDGLRTAREGRPNRSPTP